MSPTIDNDKPSRRSPITLSPLEVPKASDVLAHELRERILEGEFEEGTALPPERDLVQQAGMSRTTVREALRILEVQGLVRIKAGRAGGAFVQRPDRQSMADSAALLIRGRQIRSAALMETREALEPECAYLAARYRTDADMEEIEAANRAIAEPDTDLAHFLEANLRWHLAVATASHNEILAGLMIALSQAIYRLTESEGVVDETVRQETLRAHDRVTDAIRDGDGDAARRRMSRHVRAYAESVNVEDDRGIPLDQY